MKNENYVSEDVGCGVYHISTITSNDKLKSIIYIILSLLAKRELN